MNNDMGCSAIDIDLMHVGINLYMIIIAHKHLIDLPKICTNSTIKPPCINGYRLFLLPKLVTQE